MKKSYTKTLVFCVMITYFLGFIIGGILVFIYPEHLGEWLTFIGIPVATAIGFYCWKAKAENTVKIRKGLNKQALDLKRELEKLPLEQQEQHEAVIMDVDSILQELEEML